MLSFRSSLVSTLLLAAASARDVPSNVRDFYNSVVGQGKCNNILADGFYSIDGDSGDFAYCGDHVDDYGVVYLQGRGGELANMDIDCDGVQDGPASDGRCGSSDDTQAMTSFQDTVQGYGVGVSDLDANIHPYVVFGNVADDGGDSGWKVFDPRSKGIEPLSLMAVVCGDKLIYGIWGDENGNDGEYPMIGEASISLATACFGTGVNGNNGYDGNDVLYIAFPGTDSVPGANGADWNAQNYEDFEYSITALGDQLIQRIGSGN